MLPFDTEPALAINKARLDHLASLGIPLQNRTVLELGSGVGHLTDFWIDRGCQVRGVELQEENVIENRKRYPKHIVHHADATFGFDELGRFDIVFAYGILYHVTNPHWLIADAASVCDDLLLIETMVHRCDDGILHEFGHFGGRDQGCDGAAFVPARNWVTDKLKVFFQHVYVTRTQPRNEQFPLRWPSDHGICRAVFVASREELNLPTLCDNLPMEQEAAP